jgi:putative transposase
VAQQARNLMLGLGERAAKFGFLIRDRDTKYTTVFDNMFFSGGIEVLRSPPRANAYAQRWVRTVRRECLDRMLIYNPGHLLAVLGEFVTHDNEHRPHQSRDQLPPDAMDAAPAIVDLASARVRRRKILNGLIGEYSQAA